MKEIHLKTVNPEAFTIVLLYTKDLNVVDSDYSTELLIDTFTLAHEYDIDALKYKLASLLSLHITMDNVSSLMVFARTYQIMPVIPTLLRCI